MTRRIILSLGVAVLAIAQASAPPPKTDLKVADAAPDFSVAGIDGKPVALKDYAGKGVVLAFYPAAFTGGCTKEMSAYTASIAKFQEAGFAVVSVSTDNVPSIKYWADNVIHPTFTMASDFTTRKAAKDYGALMEARGIANRATFVIDKAGKIQHIEEGNAAVSIDGALTACSRLAKH